MVLRTRTKQRDSRLPRIRTGEPVWETREEWGTRVVCACVRVHACSFCSGLNPPHPEIAVPSASLAWGGVCSLWNMIPGINVSAACQLCCRMLAHGFPCVLIIQPVSQAGRHFHFPVGGPSPRCHAVPSHRLCRVWAYPHLAFLLYLWVFSVGMEQRWERGRRMLLPSRTKRVPGLAFSTAGSFHLPRKPSCPACT